MYAEEGMMFKNAYVTAKDIDAAMNDHAWQERWMTSDVVRKDVANALKLLRKTGDYLVREDAIMAYVKRHYSTEYTEEAEENGLAIDWNETLGNFLTNCIPYEFGTKDGEGILYWGWNGE